MSIDQGYRYPANEFLREDVRATQCVASYKHVSVISPKKPYWEGWLMVVPNNVIEKIEDLDKAVWHEVFQVVRALHTIYSTQNRTYEGLMFFGNRGAGAGQHVPHAHFHVVPRFSDRVESPFRHPETLLPSDVLVTHVGTYRSLLPHSLKAVDNLQINLEVQYCANTEPLSTTGELEVLRCVDGSEVYEICRHNREQDMLLVTPLNMATDIQSCLRDVVKCLEARDTYKGYNLTTEVHVLKGQSFPLRLVGRFSDEKSNALRTLPTLFAAI